MYFLFIYLSVYLSIYLSLSICFVISVLKKISKGRSPAVEKVHRWHRIGL